MAFNKVILVGNLTANPELKQTANGVSVTAFTIAVNRKNKTQGAQDCDFINIVAWRATAEFVARFFTKGKPILVCGQLQTRIWSDNQGQKRYATEVLADEVSFVGSPSNNNEPRVSIPNSYGGNDSPVFEELGNDESLPF